MRSENSIEDITVSLSFLKVQALLRDFLAFLSTPPALY